MGTSKSLIPSESSLFQNTSKRLQIAGVCALLSQHPILCPPKEISIQWGFLPNPTHAGVIVGNDLFWQTTIQTLFVQTGRNRHTFPRLGLAFGDEQRSPMGMPPGEHLLCSLARSATLASIQVERFAPNWRECVTWVIVDPDHICQALGDRQGIPLIARPPPLRETYRQRSRQKPIHYNWPAAVSFSEGCYLLFNKGSIQPPGMLYPERVHGFVLKLPGNNALVLFIALHQTDNERCGSAQKRRVRRWLDAGMFRQGAWQIVSGYKELRIAKGFNRANTQNNLLSGLLGSSDLPIQFVSLKGSWFRLNPIPVCSQAKKLKWICEQVSQRGARVQAKRSHLGHAKTDAQQGSPSWRNRHMPPRIGQRLRCLLQPKFEHAHVVCLSCNASFEGWRPPD